MSKLQIDQPTITERQARERERIAYGLGHLDAIMSESSQLDSEFPSYEPAVPELTIRGIRWRMVRAGTAWECWASGRRVQPGWITGSYPQITTEAEARAVADYLAALPWETQEDTRAS
jgi:hypothetical protein